MEPKPREVYAASRLSSRKNPNLLHSKLREQHYVLRLEPMILLIAIKNFGWVHTPSRMLGFDFSVFIKCEPQKWTFPLFS